MPVFLHQNQHVHFIGIGGSGLSAIARLLLESGYRVSGSDRTLSPLAQSLAAAGAQVMVGHQAANVQGADVVVRSSAVPDDNVEVQAAQAAGIPVLKRAEFLGQLMEDRLSVAVAGTHGKTTTTAMIAWLLVRLGQDPSYLIGGTARNLGNANAHAGKGPAFVVEADEYDRMFLGLDPDVIVVSYLEHDHPDCYPTPEAYFQAFTEFVQRLRTQPQRDERLRDHVLNTGGLLLVSRDNAEAHRLSGFAPQGTHVLTFGTHPEADYTAENLGPNGLGGFDYDAVYTPPAEDASASSPVILAHVSLQAPGIHNVRNSLAALAVTHQLGLNPHLAASALAEFSGTGRRFEIQGEVNGITVIDDYAHHPTEIQATLAAARARYPERRIWAVWQPHTFSRTRMLHSQFEQAFKDADRVLVTEVYAARERAVDFNNFSAAAVVEQMDHPNARFVPTLGEVCDTLLAQLQAGDVLLVLSAGDADQVSARVLAALRERRNAHA